MNSFINYAHRGASEYAPENTFAAFYMALGMGANGLETDVRKTSDGILVLFHDSELSRVTNGKGRVAEFTYEELYQLDAGSYKGAGYKNEKMVKFEDFLRYLGPRELTFAIELKDPFIEKETVEMIKKYGVYSKSIITSFEFDNLQRIRQFDKEIKIGYLTREINEEVLQKLEEIGAGQVCPAAEVLTAEKVQMAKNRCFSVRAWGVKSEELMMKALQCGVDGMTVNFPDKLARVLGYA